MNDMINALVEILGVDEKSARSIASGKEPIKPGEWLRLAETIGLPAGLLNSLRVRLLLSASDLHVLAEHMGVTVEDILRK